MLLIASCLFPAAQGLASSVTLGWDANTEPDITGYELRYGESSGNYTSTTQAGKTTEALVSNLVEGKTYYFAVFAFNTSGLASAPSNEIAHQVATTPGNTVPIATAQSVITTEDKSVSILLAGSDLEKSPLTYNVVSNPTKGTLSGIAPNLTYSPSADYQGPDSFTFTVSDGSLTSALATISITVTPTNDAPVAVANSATTTEDRAVAIVLAGSDPEKSALTYTVVSNPTKGTLSGIAPNLTYSPSADYHGPDSFTFTVSDGSLTSALATISITVTPTNDAPVAVANSATTTEDRAVAIVLAGSDPEKSALTYTVVSNPTKGTLSGIAPNLTYSPSADYHGPDSFTFTVSDGSLISALATISITVTPTNDAPVAVANSATTAEDKAVAIVLAGNDPEKSQLTYTVVSNPTKGTLSGIAPNLTYSPSADYHGPDSFTFTVSDGSLVSALATISITVTPTNDAPVAVANSATTTEDKAVVIVLAGNDPEKSALTYTVVSNPTKGILSGIAPNLTYSPSADYHGPDSFTFTVSDGSLTSALATISITVTPTNDAPVAVENSATTTEDKAVAIVLAGNDPEKSALTYAVVSNPTKGTLSGTAPNLTYSPSADYQGPDSFTFTVSDGSLTSALATISITVTPTNDAPVAVANSATTTEDRAVAIVLAGSDPEKSALTYTVVSNPTKGTLSGTAPNLTYSPSANYHGPDSFTFTVSDGSLISALATISITVTPVNDAPVANSFTVQTPAGSPKAIVLTGSDPDGSIPSFIIVTAPAKGSLSGTPPTLTYQPKPDATGSDQFTYLANDGSLNSAVATVSINITPVINEVPDFSPVFASSLISMAGTVGSPISGQLTASHPVPGEVLTFRKFSGPGWLTVSRGGVLGGTPQDANIGSNSFIVEVSDSNGEIDQADLTVTVFAPAPVNRAPVFTGNPIYAPDASENAAYTGQSLAGKALDPDAGDTITYWKISGPEWLGVATDGQLSGTPPPGSAGTSSYVIRAVDNSLATVETELRITIVGLPLPWRSSDLGWGQFAGSVSYLNGSFTQTGSGALGQKSDKTRSTYQTISGNGSITTKVRLDSNTGPAGHAGIMIRSSMAPRSPQVFLGLGSDGSYCLMTRTKAGAKAVVRNIAKPSGPDTWVRLDRNVKKKSVFAYQSADGINWTYLGVTKMPMPKTSHVGLAVSSGSDFSQTVATFSNLYVGP
ncbi:MAG: Ig-like domain-containing protein [Luteolibacter sp.]